MPGVFDGSDPKFPTQNSRVLAVTGDPPAGKAVDETARKRGWTADVEVRIGRDTQLLEHGHAHAPHPLEIDSRPVGFGAL
jgi:hypothetical protein